MKYVIMCRLTYQDRIRQLTLTPVGQEFSSEDAAKEVADAIAWVKNLNHQYFPETAPQARTWVREATR